MGVKTIISPVICYIGDPGMTLVSRCIDNSYKFQNVFGSLHVTAVSSGYCLGSSNWVINADYEKVAYVSGSSTLTTHPR